MTVYCTIQSQARRAFPRQLIKATTTCYSDFREYFGNEFVISNLGCVGDRIVDVTHRVNIVKALNPDKVFLLCGINGLNSWTGKQEIEEYEHLLKCLLDNVPDATIYVQSLLPIGKPYMTFYRDNEMVIEFNNMLQQLCQRMNITYIDIFTDYYVDGCLDENLTSDGLHLNNNEAYQKWANILRPYIEDTVE